MVFDRTVLRKNANGREGDQMSRVSLWSGLYYSDSSLARCSWGQQSEKRGQSNSQIVTVSSTLVHGWIVYVILLGRKTSTATNRKGPPSSGDLDTWRGCGSNLNCGAVSLGLH